MFASSPKAHGNDGALFLETVWSGLEYLYHEVQRAETDRIQRHGLTDEKAKNIYYCTFGSEEGDSLVCNCFLWYAGALYNFIGVFTKAFSPSENLEHEFRSVIKWRHKVAAHTSWVWPKGDSVATQKMSISLFPEFSAGHFEVGGWVVRSPTDGSSCSEWCWGLVCTHEKLKTMVSKYL